MQATRLSAIPYRAQRQKHPRQDSLHPRHFSASRCSQLGHYKTLGVPKNATKSQIKASYYKLSKEFHPDVNKDPVAKGNFQAVSEAYAVLGNERQRRAYDRSLATSAPTHSRTHHEASHTHWSYESRRRGATHAWEYESSRRPNTRSSYAYTPPPGSSPFFHTHQQHYAGGPNPFASPNVQKATGRKGPLPTDRGPSQSDYVARESTAVRAVQVTALVLLIAFIGHGFSASA